ncbi:DUF397 domain-containing protein [Micromonospora zhanjiangensis]|uniref:DUF397 domain-containing protein n=1 Tax=Micromonospora zhanjiangensis TaxID=1522057 RepID=A0ABV8KXQ5_9ACTN
MDLTGANWHKSTRSNTNGGACVEVADNLPTVAVRDTKDDGRGPILGFSRSSWATFVQGVKLGSL